jgi:hypothetical protein
MPWPIVLYTSREEAKAQLGFVPVGAMWPYETELPTLDAWCEAFAPAVAHRYLREHKHLRPPLFVKLPDGTEFCIDFCSSREIPAGGGEGWGCKGDAPLITISPSINVVGSYHGFIQDGVITDDCEGRTFPDAKGCPQ